MNPTVSLITACASKEHLGTQQDSTMTHAPVLLCTHMFEAHLKAGRKADLPHSRVQGCKESILRQHISQGELIHEAALPSIGVANHRQHRYRCLGPVEPVLRSVLPHLKETGTSVSAFASSKDENDSSSGASKAMLGSRSLLNRNQTSSSLPRSWAMRDRSSRRSTSICFSPIPRDLPPACRSRCVHILMSLGS